MKLRRLARLGSATALGILLDAQTVPPPGFDLYHIVFLRPAADRRPLAQGEGERIQSAHMANIRGMVDRGVLVAAGPFGDTPPTISATRRMFFAWRGPKGLGAEYSRLHKENPNTTEDMGVQPFCMIYRGAAWEERSSERAQILRAHDDYVEELRRQGKIGAAGPVEDGEGLLAILIFQRISDEEAWWSAAHVLPG